jgi:hypothetical protein
LSAKQTTDSNIREDQIFEPKPLHTASTKRSDEVVELPSLLTTQELPKPMSIRDHFHTLANQTFQCQIKRELAAKPSARKSDHSAHKVVLKKPHKDSAQSSDSKPLVSLLVKSNLFGPNQPRRGFLVVQNQTELSQGTIHLSKPHI